MTLQPSCQAVICDSPVKLYLTFSHEGCGIILPPDIKAVLATLHVRC